MRVPQLLLPLLFVTGCWAITDFQPGASSSLAPISEPINVAAQQFKIPTTLQGSIKPHTVLRNSTYRIVGVVTPSLGEKMTTLIEKAASMLGIRNPALLELNTRPSIPVPILGPDAQPDRQMAVPRTAGGALLKSHSLEELQSWDIEARVHGGPEGNIVQILASGPVVGFLTILLEQYGINGTILPVNLSISAAALPVAKQLPLAQIYVLGTVIEVQNAVLTNLMSIMGAHPNFLFNRIQSIFSDSKNSIARIGVFTYTSKFMSNITQVGVISVPAMLVDKLISQFESGIATIRVIASDPIGTQQEELTGDPKFSVPIAATVSAEPPTAQPQSRALPPGAVVGVAVSVIIVGVGLLGMLIIGVPLLVRRKAMKPNPQPAARARQDSQPILPPHPESSSVASFLSNSSVSELILVPERGSERNLPRQLCEAWSIDPSELAICQHSDGSDWVLGTGSSGKVYRGLRGHVQDVAIKIVDQSMPARLFEKVMPACLAKSVNGTHQLAAKLLELGLMRHLNYDKNIVQFYGACISQTSMMFVMEYMQGGDLANAIAADSDFQIGWYGKGSQVLLDIARGLHFLHANRVVHRDLKSRNILLTHNGAAKISDVGMAKLMGSNILASQPETMGTFEYAAPELLLGEGCDESVDIYSFGVICWEVCTHEEPRRGMQFRIDVPEAAPQEIADLIDACLQAAPQERPSAKEVFEVLQKFAVP